MMTGLLTMTAGSLSAQFVLAGLRTIRNRDFSLMHNIQKRNSEANISHLTLGTNAIQTH